MATSGIYNYSRTLNQIASESLELIEAVGDGETISGDHIDKAKSSLNSLLKRFQTPGLHTWTETEGTLFLKVGQAEYDFTDSSTHLANTYYETTSTAATTAGALSIAVTSIANIQDGDVIGIIQNDNDLFWTTVNGTPSGLTVNLDAGITLATVSGCSIRNYRPGTATVPELKPVSRITDVRRKEGSDYEIPINFASRQDYFNLPNKAQTGTPIQAYYSRQDVAGEDGGRLYVWNSPSSAVPVINFSYERKIQVMVNLTDTLDAPDYVHEYILYNLAKMLALKFGCSVERYQIIKEESMRTSGEIMAYGTELYPIKVVMGR